MSMMRKTIKKIILLMLAVVLAAVTLCACADAGNEAVNTDEGYRVYYITTDIDSVVAQPAEYVTQEESSVDELLGAYVGEMRYSSDETKYIAPLNVDSGFISVSLKDNQAVLDFSDLFTMLDPVRATLTRAAVTRTLTQIPGVDSVSFTINSQPLLDSSGMVMGAMTADTFIDNAGLQINPEEHTQLTLYFANETGDRLVKVNRMVVYSGNISMDKLVLNQLLEGPHDGEDAYPVISPDTKLINVTTQDGTCYVNLDSSFLSPAYNLSNDVIIYSIVNSLAELGTVNRVQFLIDSDSDVMFRESVSFNNQFVRNLDIVE